MLCGKVTNALVTIYCLQPLQWSLDTRAMSLLEVYRLIFMIKKEKY